VPGEDGEDAIIVPGPTGAAGAQGPAGAGGGGNAVVYPYPEDGEDGMVIPGPAGAAGAQGPAGNITYANTSVSSLTHFALTSTPLTIASVSIPSGNYWFFAFSVVQEISSTAGTAAIFYQLYDASGTAQGNYLYAGVYPNAVNNSTQTSTQVVATVSKGTWTLRATASGANADTYLYVDVTAIKLT
jgi:hypothetical protein